MHFDDLTNYQYWSARPLEWVHNIGWLEHGIQFPSGDVDPRVPILLEEYYRTLLANQTRGHHECGFCDCYEPRLSQDERIVLGAAELWVPGEGGKIYAAPDLVIHYLRDHAYSPPDEFVAAVLRLPATGAGWNGEEQAARYCQS